MSRTLPWITPPICPKIPDDGHSLFADNSINFATKGMMTEHVGVSKTLQVGHTLNASSGHSLSLSSGAAAALNARETTILSAGSQVQVLRGVSRFFMSSDGYVPLSGKTLFLNFESGVEVDGGTAVKTEAKRSDLN